MRAQKSREKAVCPEKKLFYQKMLSSHSLKPLSQADELVQLHIPFISYVMQGHLSLTAMPSI